MKHIKQSFLPSLLLAICLYTLLTSACVHDEFQTDDIISIKLSSDKPEGRMLTDYQAIRLLFDFTQLVLDDSDLYDYIVNVLLPPAKNYFSATLKVPATTEKFGLPGISTICAGNITVPTVYQTTGVDADLVIFVTAAYEPTAAYVAYSMICLVDSTTNRYLYLRLDIAKLIRPVGGLLHFNTAQIMQLNKESQREADLVTAMHEMTHIFGFSSSVYNYYIDATTGNTLSGHYTTTSVWGKTVAVLNVDPLTSSIKDYFGCTSLTGAYLEDEGSSGSVASHFERRIFYNEYMTSSRISDARISAFTLGLLEGSGWYQVDYSMAEPMTWGQGRGCSFASNGACMNTGVTPRVSYYPEFCSTLLERGCSYTSREGAMCGNFGIYTDFTLNSNLNWWGNYTEVADAYSDNCPIYQAFSNTDCEDPDNIGTAKISGSSSGYGSKCFMGTLSSSGSARPFGSYCFTPTCATSGGSKVINVQVADTTVTCVAEGYLGVPGFSGSLYCPDPDSFCNVLENEGFCRRKCMGRGSCVGTTCQCVPGWGSFDCGLRVYELCDRCSSDSKNPFCYGDGCGCDPSSSKCKGLSIGVIIAIAVGGAVFLIGVILVIKFRKTIMGKIRGKKPAAAAATATARTGTGAPRAANAPNLSNSIANPAMQNSNSSARPIAKPKRVVVERLQSNIPTSQEQRAPEEISPALSSSIRQVRLDFHESRSNHNVQTSPMREFMSDRAQVAERISPKGNNIIQERSVGGGSKPPSLMKLPSQAGGSQQNIVSPKGIRNDVIVEQAMEGTPGVKPSSLRRLASQTMGGSQNNMK